MVCNSNMDINNTFLSPLVNPYIAHSQGMVLVHSLNQWFPRLVSRNARASPQGKEVLELIFAFVFMRKN